MAYFKGLNSAFIDIFLDGIAIEFTCKKSMKTKAVIAGLVALAAGLTTYYIIKRRNRKTAQPVQRSHHLTDIFSKAKSYAK
jgi:hypothetical protein